MTTEPRAASRYVAIITDGNGRWAEQRGLSVTDGHQAGAENVKARLRDAVELGIEELTIYAFSTENWSRSIEEVKALVKMFAECIDARRPSCTRRACGCASSAAATASPPEIVEQMEWAEALTAAQRPHHVLHPLQLRRPRGDRRRGARVQRRRPRRSSARTCTRPTCTTRTW